MRNVYGQIEKQVEDSGSLPTANKEAIKKFAKGMIAHSGKRPLIPASLMVAVPCR